jgi:hypothetical protein
MLLVLPPPAAGNGPPCTVSRSGVLDASIAQGEPLAPEVEHERATPSRS